MILIDPPSEFASWAEWQGFLLEMRRLAKKLPANTDVQDAIVHAERKVTELGSAS